MYIYVYTHMYNTQGSIASEGEYRYVSTYIYQNPYFLTYTVVVSIIAYVSAEFGQSFNHYETGTYM